MPHSGCQWSTYDLLLVFSIPPFCRKRTAPAAAVGPETGDGRGDVEGRWQQHAASAFVTVSTLPPCRDCSLTQRVFVLGEGRCPFLPSCPDVRGAVRVSEGGSPGEVSDLPQYALDNFQFPLLQEHVKKTGRM